ncbi:MAG: esterase/lipase family protein [Gemmataceae bacterium]
MAAPEMEELETLFVRVAPPMGNDKKKPARSTAVVLLHGLNLHFFNKEKTFHPELRPWQKEDSLLVERLGEQFDVWSLSYGQNLSLEAIASHPRLLGHFRTLKQQGYTQIILIGHSAGGVIARLIVEDHPQLGISKVVQVCAPNKGSALAALKTARASQIPFLVSLTRSNREKEAESRSKKLIPSNVEFACVVGSINLKGDGVVFSRSQWSADLQGQGIPAFLVKTTHWDAMFSTRCVDLLVKLLETPLPRWDSGKVVETRRQILGS